MEYTKVQTALNHVKDAITTKLDAIKSDVTNVNNSVTNLPTTLDSKFSALTSKVDGVKTDVAGVGSKVDAGVTTLGGKMDAVKSDVAKTAKSTEISKLTDEIKKSYLDLSKTKYKELNSKFNTSVDVISVEGSGEVYLVSIDARQNTVQVQVEVDGETECFIVSTNSDTGFIYGGIIRGSGTDEHFIHSFGYCYAYSAKVCSYDLYKITNKVTDYYQSKTRFLIKKEPLKFNKSFKITVVEPFGSSNEDFDCKIAYSLN